MSSNDVPDIVVLDRRTSQSRIELMDAAEKLIGEQGLSRLTLRAVQELACHKNKSSATYHFGSENGLVSAVIKRRIESISSRRLEMIENLQIPVEHMTTRQVVEVMVKPITDEVALSDKAYMARCIFQCSASPLYSSVVREPDSIPGSHRVWRSHLEGRLMDLPSLVRSNRLDIVMSTVVGALARYETLTGVNIASKEDLEMLHKDLMDTCLAIVELRVS